MVGACQKMEIDHTGNAKGIYFKVVDSDDWLDVDTLTQTMDILEQLDSEGGVDLLVTNYVYDNIAPDLNHVMNYKNVFPRKKICNFLLQAKSQICGI